MNLPLTPARWAAETPGRIGRHRVEAVEGWAGGGTTHDVAALD